MKQRILIVDDEKEIRRSTSEVLRAEGYAVKTAESTQTAREKVQEWKPDLLLLDILLPSGDLKEFVKEMDDIEGLKILYLSVFQRTEAKRLGLLELSDKIKGHIEKPFSISTLLKKVEDTLTE